MQPSSVQSAETSRSNRISDISSARKSLAFSHVWFIFPFRAQTSACRWNSRCTQFWLYLLRTFRHRTDHVSRRRIARFIKTVNNHLLSETDNIAEKPV